MSWGAIIDLFVEGGKVSGSFPNFDFAFGDIDTRGVFVLTALDLLRCLLTLILLGEGAFGRFELKLFL